MSGKVVLFSYTKSSCSWRIRIALNLKKIAYDYHPVFLSSTEAGQQRNAEFTALNPSGRVPVLHIDGVHLSESVVIAEYLEETRPSPSLFPGDAATRSRIRTLVEIINSAIQPMHNLSALTLIEREYSKEGDVDARKRWAAYWVNRGLQAVEVNMSKWSGRFCVGDVISFADCCLVPQVYAAYRFDVDVQSYPTIWRVFSHLDKMPEVRAAHASQQPDAK